jgi:mono/diheme cytochrome c family protein
MRTTLDILRVAVWGLILAVAILPATAQTQVGVSSAPVYVPNTRHSTEPMPPGVLAWDQLQKTVEATNGQAFARFLFAFTNIARDITLSRATNFNYVTNFTVRTNSSFWDVISGYKYSTLPRVTTNRSIVNVTNVGAPAAVAVINVHASCGCTTAEVPPMPWVLPPGTNSQLRVNVNLAGKSGTLFKTVTLTTDHGRMDLILRVAIAPEPPPRAMTEAERAQGVALSKVDRQAVFKGDCAACHAKNLQGRYGKQLFVAACGICHEANPRATMVPDLHNLKEPTSEEFWRTWVTSGKAGTLMPAFATVQGGPLTDFQIASLAAYLNQTFPSRVPAATKKP